MSTNNVGARAPMPATPRHIRDTLASTREMPHGRQATHLAHSAARVLAALVCEGGRRDAHGRANDEPMRGRMNS